MEHRLFMEAALALAQQAAQEGEVPVGAVVVQNGKIIGSGRNRRETKKTVLGHAELEAIEEACRAKGDWRLTDCTLYVTLEPCVMCCGALLAARIGKVVFGAFDPAAGACVSKMRLSELPHAMMPQIIGGYMEGPCREVLQEMFRKKRTKEEGYIEKAPVI